MSLRYTHGALSALALASVTLFALDASAQEDASLDRIDLAIGIKGGATGSWVIDEMPESSNITGTNFVVDPDFFPMFGWGGNVGLSVDARYAGIIGIETGVLLSFDNGEGWTDKQDASGTVLARIYQKQESTSLRIPLMLKLSTPSGTVRPVFGAGIEFVNQSDSKLTYRTDNQAGNADALTAELNRRNLIVPSSYMMAKVALGMELNFGAVRIPIEVAGMFNPTWENSFANRVTAVRGSNANDFEFDYDGIYQGHFSINIGVLYNYGLFF